MTGLRGCARGTGGRGDGTRSHRPPGRGRRRCSSRPSSLMDKAGERTDSMYGEVTAQRCFHLGNAGLSGRKADVMEASTERLPSHLTASDERRPLRLQLNGTMGDGTQDGTWWPQTRDLSVELPDLVDNFPEDYGLVDRIVFARPDWDTAPRQVRVHRGLLEVGPCPRDTAQQVLLSMSTRREIALVVTPPEGPPSADTGAHPTLSKPALDTENEDPDAVLPWTDAGDTWWEPEAGAPSDRG
jgi:hypothetical protein